MLDPLGWPAIDEPPDPLPEIAHDGLREARVTLWRDLWARVEAATLREYEMDAEIDAAVKAATQKLRQQNGQLRALIKRMRWRP